MPSSIPYDHPSLVLGNIVDKNLIGLLKKIGGVQMKADAAQDKMNSFIMMKRSLAMTINELRDMNVDVSGLQSKVTELDNSVAQSAADYMTARLQSETDIQQLREQISELDTGEMIESPIDYTKSAIKRLPLSAESLKLDAQYFSFGSNLEDDTIANIEKYVRESTSNIGSKSEEVAKSASAQLNQQMQNHSLAGTLIITASCTHRNVALIEPFVIDLEKAIAGWNSVYPSPADRIDANDPDRMESLLQERQDENEKSLTVLSGVTYGSSFVGMVHILNSDSISSGSMNEVTAGIRDKLKIGGWLENASGGFGVDSSMMDDVKKMLSTQSISSHVSVIVMGAVPSIASNQLSMSVSKLLKPSPEKMQEYLHSLAGSSPDTSASVEASAEEAKAGNRALNAQNLATGSIMRELGSIDQGSNKVLDINSLMSAFENYLLAIKDKDGSSGVPVGFYLKKITRLQLAQCWIDKYRSQKQDKKAALRSN